MVCSGALLWRELQAVADPELGQDMGRTGWIPLNPRQSPIAPYSPRPLSDAERSLGSASRGADGGPIDDADETFDGGFCPADLPWFF
jgi:hypothetical protein